MSEIKNENVRFYSFCKKENNFVRKITKNNQGEI